jgi:ATP-dependent RNA helicase SUPV3L1/SUV3
MIPFDAKNDDLLLQWTYSINYYIAGKTVNIPGKPHNANLDALELYYSELDLYYSFNRALKLPFDTEQVLKLKNQTSDEINRILIERIKKMGRKCRSCGSKLDWNSPYGLCESCYEERHYDRW